MEYYNCTSGATTFYMQNGKLYCVSDEELKHYGVIGMKWGKRKARYASADVRSAKHLETRQNMLGKQSTRSAEARLKNVETINSLKANNDRKGVRAEKKRYKLDSQIQNREDHKSISKLDYDHIVKEAKIRRSEQSNRFAKLKDANLKRTLKDYKRNYESSVKIDDYYIAKAKGKKNPEYKKSEEYKKRIKEGRSEVGKVYVKAFIEAAMYG